MICPSCNTPNRDDAKFCKGCGRTLVAEPAKMPASVVADQAPQAPATPTTSPARSDTTLSQVNTEPVAAQTTPGNEEDISVAPTQILTPEQMLAFHQNRWQQEVDREQQNTQAAEQPAAPASQNQEPATISDIPTMVNTAVSDESISPSQPAAEEAAAQATPLNEEANPAPQLQADMPAPENEAANGTQSTETPATEATKEATAEPGHTEEAMGAFAVLPVGSMLIGRYEINQLISESDQEHVYQVIDHQGYQQCWNCGSEENAEGDEFCINCGAGLLGATYLMHEYPAIAAGETAEGEHTTPDANATETQPNSGSGVTVGEAHVVHGTIVNTFVEQGQTYMIEQPQATHNAFPNGVQLLAACNSDAGDVRRSEPNEDSTLVLLLQRVHESIATPTGVFIVADGLGGHDSGQVASRTTITVIAERLTRELLGAPLVAEKNGTQVKPFDEDEIETMFRGAIEDANTTLVQMNQRDKTDMGSTITGFMIVGEHAYIINVGDSRTYMLRGKQLYQLTTDHSLVAQLVASGLIEPDDVYTHPQRSQIFRSLGDKPNVQIDVFKQELLPGDILLSCSDGLWEMVRNPQLESILSEMPDLQTACTQLIEAANANGGEDNVSAIVVAVR